MSAPSSILCHQTIYHDPDYYSAWPAVIRAGNGDLLLSFCRTRQHLYPSGSIVTMRSRDNGRTWSEPVVAYDTLIDDRENGLTVLPDGRIIMHIWSTFWQAAHFTGLPPGSYPPDLIESWIKQVNDPRYIAAADRQGSWTIISNDHGHTWSEPKPGPDSVHGGIALHNSSLLVAAYRHTIGHCAIYGTPDPETPWVKFADIKCPTPDTHRFGEPHIAQLPSGRIVVMMRYTAIAYDDTRDDLKLWQAWSDDNGHTWSPPERTDLLGFPPHLLVLHDGRMVCSYGYRRSPYGERACVSKNGTTWSLSDEIVLRDDNANHDLGYPASVETEPGEILTIYYQKPALDPVDKHRHKVGIFATRWRVASP
ncbi:MAG: glycoside hydrolase [Cephaloticoccus sp.]|nr:glycoside hydrolase [Cephaloticoccus sp.]MCF7760519.1 glycoside hydrolase [Cephaloticoccus sp.]